MRFHLKIFVFSLVLLGSLARTGLAQHIPDMCQDVPDRSFSAHANTYQAIEIMGACPEVQEAYGEPITQDAFLQARGTTQRNMRNVINSVDDAFQEQTKKDLFEKLRQQALADQAIHMRKAQDYLGSGKIKNWEEGGYGCIQPPKEETDFPSAHEQLNDFIRARNNKYSAGGYANLSQEDFNKMKDQEKIEYTKRLVSASRMLQTIENKFGKSFKVGDKNSWRGELTTSCKGTEQWRDDFPNSPEYQHCQLLRIQRYEILNMYPILTIPQNNKPLYSLLERYPEPTFSDSNEPDYAYIRSDPGKEFRVFVEQALQQSAQNARETILEGQDGKGLCNMEYSVDNLKTLLRMEELRNKTFQNIEQDPYDYHTRVACNALRGDYDGWGRTIAYAGGVGVGCALGFTFSGAGLCAFLAGTGFGMVDTYNAIQDYRKHSQEAEDLQRFFRSSVEGAGLANQKEIEDMQSQAKHDLIHAWVSGTLTGVADLGALGAMALRSPRVAQMISKTLRTARASEVGNGPAIIAARTLTPVDDVGNLIPGITLDKKAKSGFAKWMDEATEASHAEFKMLMPELTREERLAVLRALDDNPALSIQRFVSDLRNPTSELPLGAWQPRRAGMVGRPKPSQYAAEGQGWLRVEYTGGGQEGLKGKPLWVKEVRGDSVTVMGKKPDGTVFETIFPKKNFDQTFTVPTPGQQMARRNFMPIDDYLQTAVEGEPFVARSASGNTYRGTFVGESHNGRVIDYIDETGAQRVLHKERISVMRQDVPRSSVVDSNVAFMQDDMPGALIGTTETESGMKTMLWFDRETGHIRRAGKLPWGHRLSNRAMSIEINIGPDGRIVLNEESILGHLRPTVRETLKETVQRYNTRRGADWGEDVLRIIEREEAGAPPARPTPKATQPQGQTWGEEIARQIDQKEAEILNRNIRWIDDIASRSPQFREGTAHIDVFLDPQTGIMRTASPSEANARVWVDPSSGSRHISEHTPAATQQTWGEEIAQQLEREGAGAPPARPTPKATQPQGQTWGEEIVKRLDQERQIVVDTNASLFRGDGFQEAQRLALPVEGVSETQKVVPVIMNNQTGAIQLGGKGLLEDEALLNLTVDTRSGRITLRDFSPPEGRMLSDEAVRRLTQTLEQHNRNFTPPLRFGNRTIDQTPKALDHARQHFVPTVPENFSGSAVTGYVKPEHLLNDPRVTATFETIDRIKHAGTPGDYVTKVRGALERGGVTLRELDEETGRLVFSIQSEKPVGHSGLRSFVPIERGHVEVAPRGPVIGIPEIPGTATPSNQLNLVFNVDKETGQFVFRTVTVGEHAPPGVPMELAKKIVGEHSDTARRLAKEAFEAADKSGEIIREHWTLEQLQNASDFWRNHALTKPPTPSPHTPRGGGASSG